MNHSSSLTKHLSPALKTFKENFSGEIDFREETKLIYATDASIYKEIPYAVVFPKKQKDIAALIEWARTIKKPIIARGGGTSLAGQVVGNGIIADVSLHMNQILEINTHEKWARVQPGLIRDDLNVHLKKAGLFFAPETASASRATIGGMIGNNSTGAQSLIYGNTREHIIGLKGYLADGSFIELTSQTFKTLSQNSYKLNHSKNRLEVLGHTLHTWLNQSELRQSIKTHFPHPEIKRRNHGYALDALLQTKPLNLIPLITGSEGTLLFVTEATLQLTPLPPKHCGIIAAHFSQLSHALKANLTILKYTPHACELIDHYILDCTKKSIEHSQYRDFIKGDPKAILIIEIRREDPSELQQVLIQLQKVLLEQKQSTHAPILTGEHVEKPWKIRRAGLGLLSNVIGDSKPIALVEDAAVRVADLPPFVEDFNAILKAHGLSCVHYAHAGAGELHLRPIINIKTASGQATIRVLAKKIAKLVKNYRGSLSGEHGDGRLRGEFIEYMFGSQIYQTFQNIKTLFDPENLFNPHKIVAAPKMNEQLRYTQKDYTPNYETYLDFSTYQGIVRLTEMCNGSGECRRSHLSAGLMCPSYMATRHERDTTRARANILRETLKNPQLIHPFAQKEVISVLDLCLSCKGCKAQCPSSVDIATLKAEYLSHYYTYHRPSLRTLFFKSLPKLSTLASKFPSIFGNSVLKLTTPLLRILLKLHPQRPLPYLSKHSSTTLIQRHFKHEDTHSKPIYPHKKLFLFVDEFTNVFDSSAGEKTFLLLRHLGYDVKLLSIQTSGRSLISGGFLKEARKVAQENIQILKSTLQTVENSDTSIHSNEEAYAIIGIEPSALLTFRDEQSSLLRGDYQRYAQKIAKHTFLLEEFLIAEMHSGRLSSKHFPRKYKHLAYFTHCHQQALSKNLEQLPHLFNLISQTPAKYLGEGCCGMAGTFSYEKEHADISTKIAELRLLPNLKKLSENTLIVATGLSCRDQIQFLSSHSAYHTSIAFYNALGI